MAFEQTDIRPLFVSPLLTFRLADAEDLNRRLAQEILDRRDHEPGTRRSNRLGWHSAPDFFDRAEPAHAELAAHLTGAIQSATAQLAPEAGGGEAQLDGWVNLSPPQAMNAPHDHAGAFWSGTYYVQLPPPDDAQDLQSGAIEFLDPRGPIGGLETSLTRARFTARPVAGTCLLWPGYLRHWVHPNRSGGERISVAFNARLRRSPSAIAPDMKRS